MDNGIISRSVIVGEGVRGRSKFKGKVMFLRNLLGLLEQETYIFFI
jgi:hypothetical protein